MFDLRERPTAIVVPLRVSNMQPSALDMKIRCELRVMVSLFGVPALLAELHAIQIEDWNGPP